MDDKSMKEKRKMNKQEYLLNKGLLKEINQKKKTSYYGGSMRDDQDEQQSEY